MNMKILWFSLLMLLSSLGNAAVCSDVQESRVCSVSMMELIVNGKEFDNTLVIVTGYYRWGYEMSGLFFTRDHAAISDASNAIWVSGRDPKIIPDTLLNNLLDGQKERELTGPSASKTDYVHVFGLFRAGNSGHLGIYPGEISGVFIQRE